MKAPGPSVSPTPRTSANNGSFKPSTIQEAFSLDADDQLNVARPEFIKILTSVKADTKTNIECTTSQHTKKRTFLITGKPQDVKLAKRLVIKKLTKPVKISFTVPSKLRSRIIGTGGKFLRPIVSEFDVKVDIGQDEQLLDEFSDASDIFNTVVVVTIEGDVEGSKLAKGKILDIVKEETKSLSLKVPVEETVKPFASTYLESVIASFADLDIGVPDYKSASSTISIIGDRDEVLKAKDEIKAKLDELASKITVDEVPIPKVKHQFLPIDTIMEEHNVLIKLPAEGETSVKFIGQKNKLNLAKEKAREHTSQFKVEILDMSKAHKGNLAHVKAVAHFLDTTGGFTTISKENDVVINAPTLEYLEDELNQSIPIEVVAKVADEEALKAAKRAIVSTVNSLAPADTKVINDIDEFLLPKVPEIVKPVAAKNNVSAIVLNGQIVLFSNKVATEKDDFDFEDSSEDDGFKNVDEALNVLRDLKSSLQYETLSIPASQHQFIIGERATTLKSILSEVEPYAVVVKLGGESKDQVVVRGIKPHVATVKKLIESVLEDAQEFKDKYSSIVPVPATVLSRLIGKSGQFLNSLRDEFGVRIDVVDEDESKEKSAKADIKLVGVKRNVEACQSRIASLSKRWADETLVRLKIESKFHRRLIGASGVYINRLQDKYSVRIRFPSTKDTSQDAPSNKDEVTIRGASKNVAKAEEELLDLYKFEKENGFKEVIDIPTKAIARVIGKAGETIRDIADGTGVEYEFNRDSTKEEESGIVELTLTGSKSALKEAIAKIKAIVDEMENFVSLSVEVDPKYHRDLIGRGGSKMRTIISKAGGDDLSSQQYYKLLSIPNEGSGSSEVVSQGPKEIVNKVIEQIKEIVKFREDSVESEYDLPKEKHRLIIGPNGSVRHELEEEFNITLDIPRPNVDSNTIKISGLPDSIEKLKAKLEELTKDDWNDVVEVPEPYHYLLSERGGIFRTIKSDYDVDINHGNFTRKASKLSNGNLPTPPEEAIPEDKDAQKFTILPSSIEVSDATIPWRLKGDKAQTDKVLELLKQKLELIEKSNFDGWFYSPNPSVFSKVVGPQGSKVREIRNKSNTFITVPRNNDKNSNFIHLVGSEEGLKLAETLIKKTI